MKTKTALLCTLSALSFSISALAAHPVAIVNLDTVFQQAPQGSATFSNLKQKLSPQVTQFEAQQQSLQKQIAAFEKGKKSSKSQKQTEKTQLLEEQNKLQQGIMAFQATAKQQEQALLLAFGETMKTAVTQVAKDDGIDLVLSSQTALYNIPQTDITNEVITAMKGMPVPNLAPTSSPVTGSAASSAPATQAGS